MSDGWSVTALICISRGTYAFDGCTELDDHSLLLEDQLLDELDLEEEEDDEGGGDQVLLDSRWDEEGVH